jgi:hypothetical protein
MEFLACPTNAAYPSFHFGKQFQEIAARFCSFSLRACEFVQVTPNKTIDGCVLFYGDSPDLFQN